ncbi:ABC transporter permease [Alkaliphilus sp. MSJ-5]|uniref:ABC transporter permease n=1 Tax=Alkaliphilus flagellatus TaxID=2841507 RepID=A0ABS6G276_9FIRM|nr:ABC transporter permease [Alkaliphilus flagellatus]MBU5676569.1 ABC transporter permease [Alkaliphilus flagellatus]
MFSVLYSKIMGFKRNMGWVILMTIFPIVLTLIFGGINSGGGKQTLPIVNEDNSVYSRRLIDEIKKSNSYRIKEVDSEEAERLVREQDVFFALVVPQGFKEAIEEGKEGSLIIARSVETLDIYGLQGVLNSAVQKIAIQSNIVNKGVEILNKYNKEENAAERFYQLVESKWEEQRPITVRAKVLGEDNNKKINSTTSISAGFLLFFSMYPILFLVGDILEDKKLLIWDRLMISPVSKIEIYAANLIFAFIIGMAQMLVLVLLNKIIFKITWTENVIGFVLLLGVFAFTVIGLGLFLTSFLKTSQQLSSVAPIVLTSTSMLGGLMWPVEIITNKLLLLLARFTPQFWAMDAMKKLITYNAPTQDILFPMMVLFLMGIIFMGVGLQVTEGK